MKGDGDGSCGGGALGLVVLNGGGSDVTLGLGVGGGRIVKGDGEGSCGGGALGLVVLDGGGSDVTFGLACPSEKVVLL